VSNGECRDPCVVFLTMRRRHARNLLSLEEATSRLRPFGRRHVGVRPIPVSQIVGTDGRSADFDRAFAPRRRDVAARLRQVAAAFPDGAFPPIAVQRLGEAYFVIDGHHRVAAARRRGVELIDAEVVELRARWPLRADADAAELVHAEQERLFMEQSGLECVDPGLLLRFTHPVGYVELLETIEQHGYRRMREERRVLEPHEIACDWYEREYLPALASIRRGEVADACRNATAPDIYLDLRRRRRALQVACRQPARTASNVCQRPNIHMWPPSTSSSS
jgi:hypothetical protein